VRAVFHSLPPIDEPADRPAFGIPAGAVAFLAACDLRSSMSRKNPQGAIRAFREAFGTARDRHLLLKITGLAGNERLLDVLRRDVGDNPNISLWTAPLSQQAMHRLYLSVDCVLSLHRAEGFGLIMVEGMLAGRCVIGTAWPGCSDFLTPATALTVPGRLVPVEDPQGIYGGDQQWMEPDAESAVRLLRLAAADEDVRRSIAHAGRRHAVALFGDDRYAASLGGPFCDRTPANSPLAHS
jgi:glycosyltransferase involved in cell wall biosynthesis